MFAYCTIHHLLYYYDALILGSITIANIIRPMHDIVFSMNIAGGDEYYVWRHPPVPPTTCHVQTLLSGPESVRSWQLLLSVLPRLLLQGAAPCPLFVTPFEKAEMTKKKIKKNISHTWLLAVLPFFFAHTQRGLCCASFIEPFKGTFS